jgi:hypothetical protein
VRGERFEAGRVERRDARDDETEQGQQRDRDDGGVEPTRLLHTDKVDQRQHDDRARGGRPRGQAGNESGQVAREAERHRPARGQLAGQEHPARGETEPGVEHAVAVFVGCAGHRVGCGKLGGAERVAQRRAPGEHQPD